VVSLPATYTYVPLAQSFHGAQARGAVVVPLKERKVPPVHRFWKMHAAWPLVS
jgi:hypothetical protein